MYHRVVFTAVVVPLVVDKMVSTYNLMDGKCELTDRLSYLTNVKNSVYEGDNTISRTQRKYPLSRVLSCIRQYRWSCFSVLSLRIVEENWGSTWKLCERWKYSERPVIYHAPCVKVLLDDGLLE